MTTILSLFQKLAFVLLAKQTKTQNITISKTKYFGKKKVILSNFKNKLATKMTIFST